MPPHHKFTWKSKTKSIGAQFLIASLPWAMGIAESGFDNLTFELQSNLTALAPDLYRLQVGRNKPSEKELYAALQGKSVVVIGGTRGPGAAVAAALAKRGAQVTVIGRNMEQSNNAATLVSLTHWLPVDLTRIDHIKRLVKSYDFSKVDVLLLADSCRPSIVRELTKEDLEIYLAQNYISAFVTSNELLSANLLGTRNRPEFRPRIFVMGLTGNNNQPVRVEDLNGDQTPYDPFERHQQNALCKEALVVSLSRRFGDRCCVFGLNQTRVLNKDVSLFSRLISYFFFTPKQYAEDVVLPLIVEPQLSESPQYQGAIFNSFGQPMRGGAWVSNSDNADEVWQATEKLVARHHLKL